MRGVQVWVQLAVILAALLILMVPKRAHAAAALVQTTNATSNGAATSVTASYAAAPAANNLLVVVCGVQANATIAVPAGFSTALNQSGTPSQAIFYKVAAGTESAILCDLGATSTRLAIQIYEYSGTVTSGVYLDSSFTTGSSTTPSSGAVTTSYSTTIILAAMTINTNTTFGSWTDSFTERNDASNGGAAANRSTYAGADLFPTATGTFSTSATTATGDWIGQIASFRVADGTLGVDIVDSAGTAVASPAVTMGSSTYRFDCFSVSGTLGTSSERIRVTNASGTATWTLSIAATSGATALWDTGTQQYDFNDAGGTPAGCTDGADTDARAGQLTLDPSASTITPQSGCASTGLTLGSSTGYAEGTTNSITLLSAGSTAAIGCYWDLTNVAATQQIPGDSREGTYTVNLTLTVAAS